MYFWVPLYGNGALGCSIFSFAQHVVFTTLSDPDVVDNPSLLCEEFVRGFDKLELLVMGENFENTTDAKISQRTEKTLETAKEREIQRRNSRAVILPDDIRRSIQEAKKKNSTRSMSQVQNIKATMGTSGTETTAKEKSSREKSVREPAPTPEAVEG